MHLFNNSGSHGNISSNLSASLTLQQHLPFKPDLKYLSGLFKEDRVSASRYLKSHIYEPSLRSRLCLDWSTKEQLSFVSSKSDLNVSRAKEDNLEFIEQFFSGELAFFSLLNEELDKVKYFNQVNKEVLKKGLLHFEKRERGLQLKLIENTNLYLELEEFLAFKTKLVRLEDPQQDIDDFLDKHRKWVSVSRFRHFDSCVNTFLFRESMFDLLDRDVRDSFLQDTLHRLKLGNFCAHADNLRNLGFVDFGLKQLEKALRLLQASDLGSVEWNKYLETLIGLKMKGFTKRKGSFTHEELVDLKAVLATVKPHLTEETHLVKADVLELQLSCHFNEENPIHKHPEQVPVPKVLSLFQRVSESDEGILLSLCQKILRRQLESKRTSRRLMEMYFDLIRREMLHSASQTNNPIGPSQRIPFIFRLIKNDPQVGAKLFPEKFSKDVPSRLFLGWEQQLISFLNADFGFLSREILTRLILDFPHVVVYNLFFNQEHSEVKKLIKQFSGHLDSYFSFIRGLLQLNDPELEFNEHALKLKNALDKSIQMAPHCADSSLDDLREELEFSDVLDSATNMESFLEELLKRFSEKESQVLKNFRKIMEKELTTMKGLLRKASLRLLRKKTVSVIKKMNASLKGKIDSDRFSVENYSPDLAVYCQFFYHKILSLEGGNDFQMLGFPFQADPAKPLFIKRVLPKLVVMDSFKKPKRVSLLLQNNKTRHILLKFGEDLRTDSRIQKVFRLVNDCLDKDHFQRNSLGCFGVHPLTPESGFLEWIQDSRPLSALVSEGMSKGKYNDNRAISKFKELLSQTKAADDNQAHLALFGFDDEKICFFFDDETRIIGPESLKRSFLQASDSAESFFNKRTQFMQDYALVCAIGYILGIGDRHCDNLMLTSQGRVYLIDFACCFGQGLHLAVPETVPFRLTPNLLEIMKPFGVRGSFRSQLVKGFRDILAHRWTLSDYISIYAGENFFFILF